MNKDFITVCVINDFLNLCCRYNFTVLVLHCLKVNHINSFGPSGSRLSLISFSCFILAFPDLNLRYVTVYLKQFAKIFPPAFSIM